MRNRLEEIKQKGFDLNQPTSQEMQAMPPTLDYNKIKVGLKTLDDAIYDIGDYQKACPGLSSKQDVLNAIANKDRNRLREISEFFYRVSGIYKRTLRYMAFMYLYDWYVVPCINNQSIAKEKVLNGFYGSLNLLDNFKVKKNLGDIALKVFQRGCYYGYKVETNNTIVLQELPPKYCRSRFTIGNKPAIEFNMKYFDTQFRDSTQRARILKLFPKEFEVGYRLYKQGKLKPDFLGDTNGWYLLDPSMTVKFNTDSDDIPMFISMIPLIIDLNESQAIDRKKTLQRLLKIIIQKMPMDKNGELLFDKDEARQLHNNAVQMLKKAIGLDVLTTFADVEVANLSDTNASSAQTDDLQRVERQVFNEAGVSEMIFNTDGNLALKNSILADASSIETLILQFEDFLNELLDRYNTQPKKVTYKVQLLRTTVYNYQELAKMFKEQTQLGYSKMLPQIALGQSQSVILANAYFENEILDLSSLFIPPMTSNTMSSNTIKEMGSDKLGRPEKPDDQKSTKTLQNEESKS